MSERHDRDELVELLARYADMAVRTPDGWRFSSITLTATHQQNPELVARVATRS